MPPPNQAQFSATCPDFALDEDFATPRAVGDPGIGMWTFSDDDDRVRIDREPGIVQYYTSSGDDLVYVDDPIAGGDVNLGPGGDTLIVCGMKEINFDVELGPYDREADTVIIQPGALGDVPEGFIRKVSVHGVVPNNHRIVLRLPAGMDAAIGSPLYGGTIKAIVGNTEVTVNGSLFTPLGPEVFVVQRGQ